MTKLMLIDAIHPEETRVIVSDNDIVEEYDYVTSTKKQNKGNIYLAKVTRVEPSLQAAFIEYGGERQGFLPFAEIHPDYYQIPTEDKKALMEEVKSSRKAAEEEDENQDKKRKSRKKSAKKDAEEVKSDASGSDEDDMEEDVQEQEIETLDEEDPTSNNPKHFNFLKRYKINEVIKKGQVMLVQITKEERGNKGAALSSYVSLAGRYCVLMPNSTQSSGGISRKVTNGDARAKLKKIVSSLDLPEDMNLIVRTAGSDRSRAEIKRDFDYLQRLWNDIRELTLASTAPAMVYEEGDIIKRAIRDMYQSDMEQILVEGEAAYRSAKDFMKMLMPSHAPRVKLYKGDIPIFYTYDVEHQLLSMHDPIAPLKSGGYLVLNPTEALVSVDVNSGKATKERTVEETALKTNIEAAEELARQLRLRDLAGLLVIDFIDMYEYRNRRKVERALKEALKADRAKIQVGRISPFGLLEMSRQRLRPSVTEANTRTCPTCIGSGIVRSTASLALQLLRAVEKEAFDCDGQYMEVITQPETALYVLNNKREALMALEDKYDMQVAIIGDSTIKAQGFNIARQENNRNELAIVNERGEFLGKKPLTRFDEEEEVEMPEPGRPAKRKRQRRRGGRNRRRDENQTSTENASSPKNAPEDTPKKETKTEKPHARKSDTKAEPSSEKPETSEKEEAKRRPRGARRLWGNRNRKDEGKPQQETKTDTPKADEAVEEASEPKKPNKKTEDKPAKKPSAAQKAAPKAGETKEAAKTDEPVARKRATTRKPAAEKPAAKDKAMATSAAEEKTPVQAVASAPAGAKVMTEPKGPKKSGWWAKTS
jgi:ribonuclease E